MQPVRWSKMASVFVEKAHGIEDNGYIMQAVRISSKPHEFMPQDIAKARRVLLSSNMGRAAAQLDQNVANMAGGLS